jgi:NAD(P)H-hydrate repair Nnr-like enzyme with NAD(P)H-hydrate dehydratase domain
MDQPMDLAPGFGDVLSGIREGMTADFVPDLDQIAELESELNVARQAMSNAGEMGRELMRQEVLELQAMLVDYIRRYNAANR